MGGKDGQYNPDLTGLPQSFRYDGSRDNWQPIPRTPFHEGSLGGDDGLRRVLEMVSAGGRGCMGEVGRGASWARATAKQALSKSPRALACFPLNRRSAHTSPLVMQFLAPMVWMRI